MIEINPPKELLTVAWGGDVNIGRRFHSNPNKILHRLPPLREADISIVNLECVVATGGELGIDKQERASFYYRARPEMLQFLSENGIDIVATANNHSGDYGPEALLEQARLLNSAGIAHTGSGSNLKSALQPAIRRAGGLNVAVFSLDATQSTFAATENSPGHAYLALSNVSLWRRTLEPLFAAARHEAHVILVAVHWGPNNKEKPNQNQIAVGHAIIDAGADAVLGASAHRLQGIEIYKDRPIIHGAGDLIFDAIQREHSDAGLFFLDIDKRGVRQLRFQAIDVGFCESELLVGSRAEKVNAHFDSLCSALGTTLEFSPTGEGRLLLSPPNRQVFDLPPATPAGAPIKFPSAISSPKPDWTVEVVPQECLLSAPIRLGPLELIGVKLTPSKLSTRGLLFVESFWRLTEPTTEDWRLDFQVHPTENTSKIGVWGRSSDHDPCDWMWPTSRWETGIIYRDFYSLRPPLIKAWVDAPLRLSVQLRTNTTNTIRTLLPIYSQFSLTSKEAFNVLYAFPPRYRVFPAKKLAKKPIMLWTAEQLQQVTGGIWINPPPPGWYISSASNKKRLLLSESNPRPRLFVATNRRMTSRHELYSDLSGNDWDTHQVLPSIQNRIDGAIVTKQFSLPDSSLPLLQVEDPLHALIELGIAGRQRLRGAVVAITGSAGKTSLACMLEISMKQDLRVTTNAVTNYNSRVGILHLLANTPEETDLVVMEVAVSGINAPGLRNIKFARPDIAIITNIAASHLRPGRTLLDIAKRKANIVEGVSKNGWVIIYRETEHFEHLRDRALQKRLKVLTYGVSNDATICLIAYDETTQVARARLPDRTVVEYKLQAYGLHMALNSLACLAVRLILRKDIPSFLPSLYRFEAQEGRGKTHHVQYRNNNLVVVDESYNANPLSMKMALESLSNRNGSHSVLVLGDMLELGDKSPEYHQALADPISKIGPKGVLLCGDHMKFLWKSLLLENDSKSDIRWYKNAQSLNTDIDRFVEDNITILVKGSNKIGLKSIVDKLVGT